MCMCQNSLHTGGMFEQLYLEINRCSANEAYLYAIGMILVYIRLVFLVA